MGRTFSDSPVCLSIASVGIRTTSSAATPPPIRNQDKGGAAEDVVRTPTEDKHKQTGEEPSGIRRVDGSVLCKCIMNTMDPGRISGLQSML